MRKISKVLLILMIIINIPSYALDINVSEEIDPVSLDMLIKEGIISESDRYKYMKIDSSLKVDDNLKDSIVGRKEEVHVEKEVIGIFSIEHIKQIGENSIMITFNQKLDKSAYIKNNYMIRDENNKSSFRHSDFEVRKVINDDKSIVLKLKSKKIVKGMVYELIVNNSIRSFYMLSVDTAINENNKFIIENEILNDEVISYNAYTDGYIDVKFKHEISDRFLNSKKYYNVSYNDGKGILFAKSVELLEDEDGVSRTMRIMFSNFYEKYDYKLSLDVKHIELKNNSYSFPGGSVLTNYFNVEEIDIIDNYTIDITVNTKLNFIDDKELVRITPAVALDNYEVYDDKHLILHLKKDGGLDYLSEYNLEFINFTSIDNRKLANISYTFSTEADKVQTEYLDIEIKDAKWIGDNYIKVLFNKPVDLLKNVKSVMKIKDESGKYVKIEDAFQLDPKSFVIKMRSGGLEDAYTIYVNHLFEKGSQFFSEEKSIVISN